MDFHVEIGPTPFIIFIKLSPNKVLSPNLWESVTSRLVGQMNHQGYPAKSTQHDSPTTQQKSLSPITTPMSRNLSTYR